jgi:alkylated DNA nucleotide flippase Atl1
MKTFSQLVTEIALSVPKGYVTTYGRIARAAGGRGQSSRSVTGILGKAHMKGIKGIPFHRIVYANGHIWVSEERREERMKLYKKEKIELDKNDKILNFQEKLFEFK